MRVYPERPERVVEVEYNHLRQWEAVCEGFGGPEFIIEDGGWNATCWRLGLVTYHAVVEEGKQRNHKKRDCTRPNCKTTLNPHAQYLMRADETF